ncbi:hypothetical protein JY651_18780 [Pyxidicoccus parkwayensis]|uniref:Lipoprotein n=1 Tax=Pyxidicoccus parkwayensis TaxID=2813578 RepID=A0ABX7P8Q0_9BACT|nr:hypothetical protein [Pyxidicoccus parkwaysis]QSQ26831.1 hypothetical protein JY651_18780 [Pyxidicoccus parkwaysis]
MDFRKLFHVLVIGGAMSGGATACGDEAPPAKVQDQTSGDAGTQSHAGADAGSDEPGGGGVQGW